MKIVIDARFYGTEHTGLGRYTINFLQALKNLENSSRHQFYLLLRSSYLNLSFPPNFHLVQADIPHYSLQEQLVLPQLIKSLRPDLFHSLHFNLPYFYSRPFLVTIHDLIKSHFSSKETTTKSSLVFKFKRWGYHQVVNHALYQSVNIIVPSNSVKQDILHFYPDIEPQKIIPVYEAPDPVFLQSSLSPKLPIKLTIPDNRLPITDYILYVGNAYPHKNLTTLLQAFRSLNHPRLNLAIVSKPSPFLNRTLQPFSNLQTRLLLFHNLTDLELVSLYRQARLVVIPSLMEGFSLTGLEAISLGVPVVASDIPVHREIYGQAVRYANPHSSQAFAQAIHQSLQDSYLGSLPRSYSWTKLAQSILNLYENYEKNSSRLRSAQ